MEEYTTAGFQLMEDARKVKKLQKAIPFSEEAFDAMFKVRNEPFPIGRTRCTQISTDMRKRRLYGSGFLRSGLGALQISCSRQMWLLRICSRSSARL